MRIFLFPMIIEPIKFDFSCEYLFCFIINIETFLFLHALTFVNQKYSFINPISCITFIIIIIIIIIYYYYFVLFHYKMLLMKDQFRHHWRRITDSISSLIWILKRRKRRKLSSLSLSSLLSLEWYIVWSLFVNIIIVIIVIYHNQFYIQVDKSFQHTYSSFNNLVFET